MGLIEFLGVGLGFAFKGRRHGIGIKPNALPAEPDAGNTAASGELKDVPWGDTVSPSDFGRGYEFRVVWGVIRHARSLKLLPRVGE